MIMAMWHGLDVFSTSAALRSSTRNNSKSPCKGVSISMKVYISADIEGITGTTSWSETELNAPDYQFSKDK